MALVCRYSFFSEVLAQANAHTIDRCSPNWWDAWAVRMKIKVGKRDRCDPATGNGTRQWHLCAATRPFHKCVKIITDNLRHAVSSSTTLHKGDQSRWKRALQPRNAQWDKAIALAYRYSSSSKLPVRANADTGRQYPQCTCSQAPQRDRLQRRRRGTAANAAPPAHSAMSNWCYGERSRWETPPDVSRAIAAKCWQM